MTMQATLGEDEGRAKMDVLIVEDDPDVSRLLVQTLTADGHNVTLKEDGLAAWADVSTVRYAVAIVDIGLPGIDGLELVRRIRTLPQYVYTVVLTARGNRARHLAALDAGADDFMRKPVDSDILAGRLKVASRILGLRSHVRTLEGMLPICMECKAIKDDAGQWTRLEQFVAERSSAEFSHGYCDVCIVEVLKKVGREVPRNRG